MANAMEPETIAAGPAAPMPRRRSRAWRWLAALVILAAAAYSIFWYIMAGRVADNLTGFIIQAGQNGVDIRCPGLRKSGFPLRLDLSCSSLAVAQKPALHAAGGGNAGLSANSGFSYAGGFVSAGAPVYAPHWISLALGAPASLKLPGLPQPLAAGWQNLECEGDFTARHPRNLSLSAEKPSIAHLPFISRGAAVAADFIRFDSRQKADGRAALTLSFDNLAVPYSESGEQKQLPAAEGAADIRIEDGAAFYAILPQLLQSGDTSLLRGRKGEIRQIALNFAGGGGVSLAGPFSVAEDGRLNGEISLTIKDSAALLRTMRAVAPAQADNLEKLFFVLNAMPKNAAGEPQLPLYIHNGRVQVSFLRLGKLPRL